MGESAVSGLLQRVKIAYWSGSDRSRDIQIRRATRPGTWLYLIFLGVLAFATDYPDVHPKVFFFFTTVIFVLSFARGLLVYLARRSFSCREMGDCRIPGSFGNRSHLGIVSGDNSVTL